MSITNFVSSRSFQYTLRSQFSLRSPYYGAASHPSVHDLGREISTVPHGYNASLLPFFMLQCYRSILLEQKGSVAQLHKKVVVYWGRQEMSEHHMASLNWCGGPFDHGVRYPVIDLHPQENKRYTPRFRLASLVVVSYRIAFELNIWHILVKNSTDSTMGMETSSERCSCGPDALVLQMDSFLL